MIAVYALAIFGYILALEQCLLLVKANPTEFTEATIVKQKLNSETANSNDGYFLKFKINGTSEKSIILYCNKKKAFYINWNSESQPIDTSELKDTHRKLIAEMMKIVTRSKNPEHSWNDKTKIKLSHISDDLASDDQTLDDHQTSVSQTVQVPEKGKDATVKRKNPEISSVITIFKPAEKSESPESSVSKIHASDFTEATIVKKKLNSEIANSNEVFLLEFKINGTSEKSVILYCKKKNAFYINWKSDSYPIDTSELKHSHPNMVAEMTKTVTNSKNPEHSWNAESIKVTQKSADQEPDHQKADDQESDHQKLKLDDHQTSDSQPKTVAEKEKDMTIKSKNPYHSLTDSQAKQSASPESSLRIDASVSKIHATDFTDATIVKQKLNSEVAEEEVSENANSDERFLLEFKINGEPKKSVILYCKKKNAFYINWKSDSYPIDTSQRSKEEIDEMMEKVTKSRNPEHNWNAEPIKLSQKSDGQESDHQKSGDQKSMIRRLAKWAVPKRLAVKLSQK